MQWGVVTREKGLKTFSRRLLTLPVVIFGLLWALTLWANRSGPHRLSWQTITVVWIAIGATISLWGFIPEFRTKRKQFQFFRDAVMRNQAVVLRIASEQVVEFEEWEDEGPCYAFQLSQGEIVFVSGQDFDSSARFPNSDFSLVHIVSSDGFLVERLIAKDGRKLVPIRKISAEEKSELIVPEHLAVIHGQLDQLERLLAPNKGKKIFDELE
jgi:hypothetical protein